MTCSLFVVAPGGIPYVCGFLGILGAIPGAIIGIFNNSASGGEDIYWFPVPDTTSQECHVSAVQD
jgi:hypothetical protein